MSKYSLEKQLRRRERGRLKRIKAVGQLGGKCAQCGAYDDLHFDHIDPKTKLFDLADGWARRSQESLETEIAKCQLLCKDCHQKKSLAERPKVEKKPKKSYYKRKTSRPYVRGRECGTVSKWSVGCRCDLCVAANRAYNKEYQAKAYKRLKEARQGSKKL